MLNNKKHPALDRVFVYGARERSWGHVITPDDFPTDAGPKGPTPTQGESTAWLP
jgi:hypothetical protein